MEAGRMKDITPPNFILLRGLRPCGASKDSQGGNIKDPPRRRLERVGSVRSAS